MALKTRLIVLEKELHDLRTSKGEVAETGGNEWHDNAAFEEAEQKERNRAGHGRKRKEESNN